MSTGPLPVLSRAHLDGLAHRFERFRDGLALARKRGLDQAQLLERIEVAGSSVSREDFLSASATIGPAVPLLSGVYIAWVKVLDDVYPALLAGRSGKDPRRRSALEAVARGAWALAHSAMILIDSADREWVRTFAVTPSHVAVSPWSVLTMASAFPFVVRAAWLAGRLGKPMMHSYKTRFTKPVNTIDQREAGWGLACMGLRHASLRSEAFHALRTPAAAADAPREAWAEPGFTFFHEVARLLDAKEEALRAEGDQLGRDFMVSRTKNLDPRFRFTTREEVPDDLVLPGLFDGWYDANNGERGGDMMLVGVVAAARARAQDFYFPATILHAMRESSFDLAVDGESMVAMRRKLLGIANTVRHGDRPGRNDACPCGSGKKFKKCHGP
jgi:hypothetical protein